MLINMPQWQLRSYIYRWHYTHKPVGIGYCSEAQSWPRCMTRNTNSQMPNPVFESTCLITFVFILQQINCIVLKNTLSTKMKWNIWVWTECFCFYIIVREKETVKTRLSLLDLDDSTESFQLIWVISSCTVPVCVSVCVPHFNYSMDSIQRTESFKIKLLDTLHSIKAITYQNNWTNQKYLRY